MIPDFSTIKMQEQDSEFPENNETFSTPEQIEVRRYSTE